MKYDKSLFPSRLKEAMKDYNLTQAQLSKLSGISRSAISQYLSGDNTPNNNYADILARLLDVNKDWLLGGNLTKKFAMISSTPKQPDDHDIMHSLHEIINSDKNTKAKDELFINTCVQLNKLNYEGLNKASEYIDVLLESKRFKK